VWLHLPTSTSSASAQASPVSTSDSDSRCRALERSATWRTKSRTRAFWRRVLRTELSTTRLSGLTCEPSTVDLGAAVFIASLPVIHASRSPLPDASKDVETDATSGRTSRGSSTKSRRTSSSSKTSTTTFDWAFQKSGETYDRWVTRLRLASGVRRKSALRIYASDSSLLASWGTPCVGTNYGFGQTDPTRPSRLIDQVVLWPSARVSRGGYTRDPGTLVERPTLEGVASTWPTPNAHPDAPNSSSMRENGKTRARLTDQCLGRKARNWPTARAEDAESYGNHPNATDSLTGAVKAWPTPDNGRQRGGAVDPTKRRAGGHQVNLIDAAAFWPTPDASPKRGTVDRYTVGNMRTGRALKAEAQLWPSPVASDGRSGRASAKTLAKNSRPLRERALLFILSRLGRKTTKRGRASSPSQEQETRVLNPRFVEHLMGLPIGWTDCERSATEPYRSWLRSHSILYSLLITSGNKAAEEAA
jgi:hypothetical protein